MGIFISYSHADTETVTKIVALLKKNTDLPVWYDHELRGGDHYFSIIAEQILENEYFIFIVSDNSVQSDWCIHELQFAMAEKRKIIAIWLDNIALPPQVKFIIQSTHYVNWYQSDADTFSQNIAKCFSGEVARQVKSSEEGSSLRGDEKYFVVEEDVKQIERLLQLEKNNTYSECFKPQNAVLLGLAFELGIKTEADLKKAEFYYKVGMFKGNEDASYLYAALMVEKDPENTKKYVEIMRNAAEKGSVLAMTYFGDVCYEGRFNLPVDKGVATQWWKKAAELGSPVSQYYMSYAYRWGENVEKDPGLSLMYALSSLEKYFPRAYRMIGFLYQYGEFVDKDIDKAKSYFEQAIQRGDHLSLCYLGGIYHYEEERYDESIKLYQKAVELAENGKIKSGVPYYRMGQSLYYGDGIEKDLPASIEYYFKAAERKHKNSKEYVVGHINELPSKEQRIPLLERAAALDCKDAEYHLACAFVDKEDEKAITYFSAGAEKGNIFCVQALLARYYGKVFGKKEFVNREKALKYFQLLFSLASVEDLDNLKSVDQLSIYYYAYGVELDYDTVNHKPDKALALHYFKKSLETDNQNLDRIIGFAIDGFLFPEESGSGFLQDILHCEDILDMAEQHPLQLAEAKDSAKVSSDASDATDAACVVKTETLDQLIRAHSYLETCYRKGTAVSRDREKQAYHASRAQEYTAVKRKMEGMKLT